MEIAFGEAAEVFEKIQEFHTIQGVYSHQETGVRITYDRDLKLQKCFAQDEIVWHEYQANGVVRGMKNRSNWDHLWMDYMQASQHHPNLEALKTLPLSLNTYFPKPKSWADDLGKPHPDFQPGGETYAWKYLKGFTQERARFYNHHMSLPEQSRYSCSRISPYLSWGNLSTRQVYQFYERTVKHSPFAFQLKNFRSRLQWRCHFMQRFEMEDRMEFENLNWEYNKLEQMLMPDRVQAWEEGKTGYPLVDACMRCIKQTGYLNFRMRAMLVSFLTHLLWQPWQSGVYHLARLFLDYEPGIHFCQFQMQASVTGFNNIRIYNPVKQSQEKDPEAVFLRKWLPELQQVPLEYVHTPWKMTPMEQNMYHCQLDTDYPSPIIDWAPSRKHATEQLFRMKGAAHTQQAARKIMKKHVKQQK